jgi:hypothetical protein
VTHPTRRSGPARGIAGGLAALALTAASVAAAAAEDTPRVGLELNKLEPVEGACRAYMVFRNQTDHDFEGFKLDLVMFDPDGIISGRLAVQAAPLAADKTVVRLFDIQGLACDQIDRVLMNGVLACDTESGETPNCQAMAEPSSKATTGFFK